MSTAARFPLGPRYRLVRELGCGGMGRVFLVHDAHLGLDLALKLLHEAPAHRDDAEQARREFALLARLEHPGIARAYDFGYLEERPYFTSQFIAGRTPGRTSGWRQAVGELLEFAPDLCEAVDFLHRNDILHLDIKPSNVIRPDAPEARSRAVLVDFGLCRRGPVAEAGARVRGSLPSTAS